MGLTNRIVRRFFKEELRAAYEDGFTARAFSLQHAVARTGDDWSPENLGYVEAALRILENAFTMAEVEPAVMDPVKLAAAVRRSALVGEAPHLIEAGSDGAMLIPVKIEDVTKSGRYKLEGSKASVDPSDVLLFPWSKSGMRGSSPLGQAISSYYYGSSSVQLALLLEAALNDEARKPVGDIIPIAEGASDEDVQVHSSAIEKLRGRTYLAETQRQDVTSGSPMADWEPRPLRPDPSEELVKLREDVANDLIASLGIPPSMVRVKEREDRESARQFLVGCLRPIARRIEAEFREKLSPIRLTFPEYKAADDRSKAQAVKGYTEAGVDLERALKIVGVEG